ncbi:ATP synthase F1 subunit epsilon [Candidatus Nomurabacteria bacterium RIFCSPLOWO2_02_FULL_40_10]|uniref:ATP synthase epsilon chain n=2 Tax=Candidatus Nomuraibacteriota TaxID=1752729 RepID=A0A1F6XZL2_9BACT|nr:MAG: ATP synthase F1 subunit epsilon [Candidatus Nomurabacteria bacterium RIFCSPHIGHO2_01_FULL_39_10]OGI99559.1 MAG: ATP synthase F1 subunit epsilon [Candidatus Nomurabacteria bacterium RIFCSPLOWO2_02_FULL_40_10]
MTKSLKLKIVTPERLVLEEMVDQVTLPTTEGEITILPEHISLIAGLASGDVVAVTNGEHVPMAVAGGFVEIKTNEEDVTEVAVLADFAEHVSELTDEKIIQAKARAEELKKQMPARNATQSVAGGENKEHVDFEHFEAELERSLTRVKIADKWRTRKYRK